MKTVAPEQHLASSRRSQCHLNGLQSNEVPGRKSSYKTETKAQKELVIEALILFFRYGDRQVISPCAVQINLDTRVLEDSPVPSSRPVVDCHE